MKTNRIFGAAALTGLALALTGCVLTSSVYPFYFEKDVVFEPALLWDWTKGRLSNEHWKFERDGEKAYELTYNAGGRKSRARAHLFRLRDQAYLDLIVPDATDDAFPAIPTHLLLRVIQTGPTLRVAALDREWLGKLLAKNPTAIRHQVVEGGGYQRLVLTADTAELQRFVVKHLKTEAAWKGGWELELVPTSSPSR